MKKLSVQEKKRIKAGKGVAGSFLTGIGNIIKAIGGAISETISTIATAVFMFTDHAHHDKVTYKLGNDEVVIDDSKSNGLRLDNHSSEEPQVKLTHTTPTTQFHLEDAHGLGTGVIGEEYGGCDFT